MIKYDSYDKEWVKVIESEERKTIGESSKKILKLIRWMRKRKKKILHLMP